MNPRCAIRRVGAMLTLCLVGLGLNFAQASPSSAAGANPGYVFAMRQSAASQSDLYLVPIGGESLILTNTAADESQPTVSPDGKSIAYVSNAGGASNIYVAPLVQANGSFALGNSVKLTADIGRNASPDWSRDGKKLAYASIRECGMSIYTMNADGTDQKRVSNLSCDSSYSAFSPRWTPNGVQIIISRDVARDNTDIEILDPATGLETNLTASNPNRDENGVMAPDGFIYYSSQASYAGNFAINKLASDGTVSQMHSNASFSYVAPEVSLDGTMLLFGAVMLQTGNMQIATETFAGDSAAGIYAPTGILFDVRFSTAQIAPPPTTTSTTTSTTSTTSTTTTQPPPVQQLSIVAIGDSVAAGEGLNYGWTWVLDKNGKDGTWVRKGSDNPLWEPQSDTTPAVQACHRSAAAFPNLVATALHAKLTTFACTGAAAQNGILNSREFGNGLVGATQLGSAYIKNVGDSPNAAYDAAKPDIVLLNMGANDAHFSKVLSDCYQGGNYCRNEAIMRTLLQRQLDGLRNTLTEIQKRGQAAGKVPKVYLNTYYDPFPSTYVSCRDISPVTIAGVKFGISRSEYDWIRSQYALLNSNIKNLSGRYTNVTLVDQSGSIKGHELCSKQPWVYGASIRTLKGEKDNPAPFHPTLDGQQAIASRVLSLIKN